jgi:FkbM family methyltransferase
LSSIYYSSLARLKLALRSDTLSGLRRLLRKFPPSRWAARALIPDQSEVWVKVERGLAQGLWLRLNPTLEADYWLGDHEPVVQEALERLCRPGCVVYDVGAHVGFFSLSIARLVGPQGKVFAFEPDRENSARLKEHAARNGLEGRVQVVEAAVWSSSSKGVAFRQGGIQKSRGGVAAEGIKPVLAEGAAIEVPAISLDAFTEQGHPRPDVVKIDVEGAECGVLKGGERLFSRSQPALICEVHHAQAAEWIAPWLGARGYAAEWHVPEEGFPRTVVAEVRPGSERSVS